MEILPRLKVEIPDVHYWKRQISCQYACPVHTDARGYVRAIAEGDFEKAYLIARAPNPLASICGRICGAPCEAACRRASIDQSIAIRGLKRSAVEESKALLMKSLEVVKRIKDSFQNRICSEVDDLGGLLKSIEDGKIKKVDGYSVGIIGSGPAGLAAAHDLALLGFSVVVYEMEPIPGGLLSLGIPLYRLPREIIDAEIDVIKALGVEFRTNCTVGKDVTLGELRRRHHIMVIAVGYKKSRFLPILGMDAEGVLGGVEFLRVVALGEPTRIGKNAVVIGGGNVAYDVARTALRRQQMDVVGTVLRERKDVTITLVCLERRDEMLASELEILEGEAEGINRINGYGPQEILVEEGKVKGVLFYKVISIFDENKRFAPKFDPNEKLVVEADTVLVAIGQRTDISFVDPVKDGVAINERGMIVCDPETLETTAKGVFLAGDIAYGPKIMIDAIASGKKAARSIFEKVTGRQLQSEVLAIHAPIENYEREFGYEKIPRQVLASVSVEERIISPSKIIEKGFSCAQARIEGSRCLDCGVNTMFDGNRCILCGGCVDVCPELCLKLVPVSELQGDKNFDELTDLVKKGKETDELTAIIKDEEKCIRCGLCAIRCPTGAITMERFTFGDLLKQI